MPKRTVPNGNPAELTAAKATITGLANAGRLGEAKALCARLCKSHENDAELWGLLARINSQMGNHADAASCWRTVISLQPRTADAYHHLATALQHAGQKDEAEKVLRRLLKKNPSDAAAHVNLGNLLLNSDRLQEALKHYRQAVRLRPDAPEPHFNLGNAYKKQGNAEEAEKCYRRALKINPKMAVASNNLGLLLHERGDFDGACKEFRQAIESQPNYLDPCLNIAKSLREQNRLDEAVAWLDRALNLNPEYIEAHWDRALLWLLMGDFKRGWAEYEWRLRGNPQARRPLPCPNWDSSPLEDRTILVHAEQGIGDEIMFASCIPDLSNVSKQVVVLCEPRLAPLFARSFPDAIVHGARQNADVSLPEGTPDIDVQLAIGSLPLHFRPDIESFPRHSGYLTADPALRERWRERFSALGSGLKIGISWRGGHISNTRLKRSIPLQQWLPLLRTARTHFINLQYGDCTAELAAPEKDTGIVVHDWEDADPLKDLENFAAQISELDLVISIDNSTVHMAGALGVPTWVLQPYAPDWRWLLETEESYWYPAIRQFRQPQPGDWDSVLARVAEELAALANTSQDS